MRRHGKLDHREPMRGCRDGGRAVRRVAGGNEPDRGQAEFRAELARELEMAAVDGVERAAEYTQDRFAVHVAALHQAAKSSTPVPAEKRSLPASMHGRGPHCGADSGRSGE